MAAVIGDMFKLDPVTVLASDIDDWIIRVGALRHVQYLEAERARKEAAKNNK